MSDRPRIRGQALGPTSQMRLAAAAGAALRLFTALFLVLVSLCGLPMALFGLIFLASGLAVIFSGDAPLAARAVSVVVVLTCLTAAIGPLAAWVLFGDRRHLWALAVGALALAAALRLASAVDKALSGFGPS